MNDAVDTDRRTWTGAIKLALLMSIVAGLIAIAASAAGGVPQAAVVLPVIVVAFVASWIQTGRIQRGADRGGIGPARGALVRSAPARSGSLRPG